MLVSLGIFAVITGLVLANFRNASQNDELRIASQLAANAIRRLQTSAIAGTLQPVCSGGSNDGLACLGGDGDCGGGTCAMTIPRGYGIRFSSLEADKRTLIEFVDGNGNRQYDAGEELYASNVSSGRSVIVQSVSPSNGGALDIVFAPPKPTVYFNGATSPTSASVTLAHGTTGLTRTVTVNRISGQVSAE